MKTLIVAILAISFLPGCVSLSYHDSKVKEAFAMGYNIGAPQMQECADRLAKFNQYIQGMQRPAPQPVAPVQPKAEPKK